MMKVSSFLFEDILFKTYLLKRKYCQSGEGMQYFGFTYYPRSKNFKDPPYEPSKLFLIKRIKSMRGRNPTERQCLALLNIDGDKKFNAHINVVKNIPSTNALLWKVKHIVEIKPITWKNELPKDYLGSYLRDTGELIIIPELKITPEQLEATEEMARKGEKPDRTYLKDYLKRKWWDGFTGTA